MATKNSIASNIPIEVSKGGTNTTSLATSYGTLYFDSSGLATVAATGSSGNILKSNGPSSAPSFQPAGTGSLSTAFLANLSADATSVTGDGTLYTVVWDTEIYDLGGDFDTSTGIFTAPSTGKYYLVATMNVKGAAGSNTGYLEVISTSNRDYEYVGCLSGERNNEVGIDFQDSTAKMVAVLADMDTADTAVSKVAAYGDGLNDDVLATSASYFCGYQTP